MSDPVISRLDRRIAIGLGTLVYLVYLLGFSGVFQSMDGLQLFDETESFAVYQDVVANQTVFLGETATAKYEIGQPILAIPLYLLAYHLPFFGMAHMTLQFNLIVTAILVAVFYLLARELAYSRQVSLVGALCLGLGTILWPYTQTFFRESLTALTLFLVAGAALKFQRVYRDTAPDRWKWLAALVASSLLAILVRETSLMVLPFISLILVPDPGALSKDWKRTLLIVVILGAAVILVLVLLVLFGQQTRAFEMEGRYNILLRLQQILGVSPRQLWDGVSGMLFSPGRSIWLFSPVLLLSLAGPFLVSRKRWRETILPFLLLMALVLAYTALRERHWQGGVAWGPRYLVMVTPFMMLPAMPAVERLLKARRNGWRILLFGLLAFAILIQIGGVWVHLHDYYSFRQQVTGISNFEVEPVWQLRWSQAIGSLLYLPQAHPDILWLHDGILWAPILCILAGIALTIFFINRSLRTGESAWQDRLLLGPVFALLVMLFGLSQAYHDSRYAGDFPELMAMIEDLSDETTSDEIVLLDSRRYALPFMNYYRGEARWYSAPDAPGDLLNPSVPPGEGLVTLEERVGEDLIAHLDRFISGDQAGVQSLLLVSAGNEFVEGATRPAEWYLSERSFPIEEREYHPLVRWVRFLPMAVEPGCERQADDLATEREGRLGLVSATVRIRTGGGDELRCGIDDQVEVSPGTRIGVSLLWEVRQQVPLTLISSFHLLDASGAIVQQFDGEPSNGFSHSYEWAVGDLVRDNAGFDLAGLPPGEYRLFYTLYQWPGQQNLSFTTQDGAEDWISVLSLIIR